MKAEKYHVVLIGDAILDNEKHIKDGGGKPIIEYFSKLLPKGSKATLLANSDAKTEDIINQIQSIPEDATFLVFCVGANTIYRTLTSLTEENDTVGDVIANFQQQLDVFREEYVKLMSFLLVKQIPIIICQVPITGFQPPFFENNLQEAVIRFNDVIRDSVNRYTVRKKVKFFKSNITCTELSDFAGAINLKEIGGFKISAELFRHIANYGDFHGALF
jgi:hypothetical protein